jgi:uncharacterized protein (UPF0216 family)
MHFASSQESTMAVKANVTLPAIHMNGTSAKTLCDEIRKAHSQLTCARMALADMTVHSRDHYVKADKQSYEFARNEHLARLAALDKIADELTALYVGIEAQAKGKAI